MKFQTQIIRQKCLGALLAALPLFLSGPHSSLGQTAVDIRPEVVLQSGHSGVVFGLAYSPDGRWLASASNDSTVKIWDLYTERSFRTLTGHTGPVSQVTFSRDGRWLASAGDTTVRLWKIATWKEEQRMSGHNRRALSLAFSHDSQWLASGDVSRVLLWRVATGEMTMILRGHTGAVKAVEFSPDDRLLASASHDHTVKIWDVATSKEKHTLIGHKDPVNTVAFSPNGQWLATAGGDEPFDRSGKLSIDSDYTVKIWDPVTGRLQSILSGHTAMIQSIAFSTDGKVLASGSGSRTYGNRPFEIILWDFPSGRILQRLPTGPAYSVAFQPNTRLLASASPDRITLRYLGTLKEQILARKTNPVNVVTFTSDNRRMLMAGVWNVRIWDIQTGRELPPIGNNLGVVASLAVSRDDRLLAAFSYSRGGRVTVWELNTGRESHVFNVNGGSEGAVAWSADARRLAAASSGTIFLWDMVTGGKTHIVSGRDSFLALSPDGNWLASAGDDQKINLWNVATGEQKLTLTGHERRIRRVAFSPDGRLIASASVDNTVKLWDSVSGKNLATLRGHRSFVEAIAFSADGRQLASASGDQTVKLWDLEKAREIRNFYGHTGTIRSVAFTPNGRWIVTASDDNTVRVWDPLTGEELCLLSSMTAGGWVVVSPNGLFDGTADALQEISWRAAGRNDTAPLDSLFNDFYYPNLLSELFEGNRPKPQVDIATVLQFPGLRLMLAQGLARLDQRNGKAVLCFAEKPSAPSPVSIDGILFDVTPVERFSEDDPTCRYSIELPAGKQYQIINPAGSVERKEFKLPYDGVNSDTAHTTLHVLTIAISNYESGNSGFTSLPASVRGAREIEDFFAKQKRSPHKPYREIRIWDGLYDAAATRAAIRRRLSEMAQEVKEDDVALLFFSGHGVVPAGQEMFYFAPIDMRGPGLPEQRKSGLNTAMLAEALREMPARRVVLIIDACQSGGAIESLGKIGEVKARIEQRRAQLEKAAGGGHRHEVGMYVIAAATPLQEAVQPRNGNGALVTTLLEVLRESGRANGGSLSIRQLVKHVHQRLPEISATIGQRHTPMTVTNGVDFAIAGGKPAPP